LLAAAACGVAVSTAHRWVARWRCASPQQRASLTCPADRSSRPHHGPRRVEAELEQQVVEARRATGWRPAPGRRRRRGAPPDGVAGAAPPRLLAAAAAAGYGQRTAAKWLARWRQSGQEGLFDRSSAPRRVVTRTPPDRVEAIVAAPLGVHGSRHRQAV
jgi:transposase